MGGGEGQGGRGGRKEGEGGNWNKGGIDKPGTKIPKQTNDHRNDSTKEKKIMEWKAQFDVPV